MGKNVVGRADHGAPGAPWGKRARKALVAVAGTAAMVVSTGALEESAEVWVNAGLALLTAAGVYTAKNAPAGVPHDDTLRA